MNALKNIGYAVLGLVVFFILSLLFGVWGTIDQGERGVLLTNGSYSATLGPGLFGKWPLFQGVEKISNRQITIKWDCNAPLPNKVDTCPEGHATIMQAYSRDQQPADIRISVVFYVPIDKVEETYTKYRNIEQLANATVWRKTPQEVKTVFGQFDAQSVIQNRKAFNDQVAAAVAKALDGPVVIVSVQIENIDFSDTYETAVDQRMLQQVAVEKQRQTLELERINADILLTQATGRANSVKAEADAAAYSTQVQGLAEADAIKLRGQAMQGNPLIVDLNAIQKWNGVLPSTMPPNGTVPFLNVLKP